MFPNCPLSQKSVTCRVTRDFMKGNETMHYEKKIVATALVGLEPWILGKLHDCLGNDNATATEA